MTREMTVGRAFSTATVRTRLLLERARSSEHLCQALGLSRLRNWLGRHPLVLLRRALREHAIEITLREPCRRTRLARSLDRIELTTVSHTEQLGKARPD